MTNTARRTLERLTLVVAVACAAVLALDCDDSSIDGDGAGDASLPDRVAEAVDGHEQVDAARCGNGVLDEDEQCDGAQLGGRTCADLEHAGGELACDAGCRFVESGCYDCDVDGHTFDERREAFLTGGWEAMWAPGPRAYYRTRALWAWLEDRNGEGLYRTHAEDIRSIVRGWAGPHCTDLALCPEVDPEDPDHCWYWGYSFGESNMAETTHLLRMLVQYGDRLEPDVRACLERLYPEALRTGGGNPNTLVHRMAPLFIAAQEERALEVRYDFSYYIGGDFTWEGRSYQAAGHPDFPDRPGSASRYNAYELTRDWWMWRLDEMRSHWDVGGNENDSEVYTFAFFNALLLLYDFADRPLAALGGVPDPEGVELKRRVKMVLDLLMLDNALDYSAYQHGGFLGRTYLWSLYSASQGLPHGMYWPLPQGGTETFYYASDYHLPYVIEDLGALDDEPDDYWHVNRENRMYGKWTWVTKDYNLGGGTQGPTSYLFSWILNIGSTSSRGDPVAPFMMFINTKPMIERADGWGDYPNALGEWGYIWRYAGLVSRWGGDQLYLHTLTDGDAFDQVIDANPPADGNGAWELTADWAFFKKGKVLVAVGRYNSNLMSIEVAREGVDYTSIWGFRQAIHDTAFLGIEGDRLIYRTSRGDTIGFDGNPLHDRFEWTEVRPAGSSEYQPMDDEIPVTQRIHAEDSTGAPMVSWDGERMTVERHGCRRVYDFSTWTVRDENGPECPVCHPAG